MEEDAPSTLKRFVLWDYTRGSWQYDVMVGLILAFIFLTPREWFRDQPRIPHSSNIVMLPEDPHRNVFWIEPELVNPIPEPQRLENLSQVLSVRTGKKQTVTRIEAITDSEQEIKWYMAFTKP